MQIPAAGPPPLVVLLTGLPSSGKTTLGRALSASLSRDRRCQLLDGDELRRRLPPRLGFSADDRRHQGERALYLAELLTGQGVTVVLAVIAPLGETRRALRATFGDAYLEVHLDVAAEVRAARDTRGVYARAVAAGDPDFTSIDDVYERPADPDLVLDTAAVDPDSALGAILAAVAGRRERLG